jgi:hypothetical protein
MRSRAIDDLWQAWHVDRQVKEALEQVLEDEAFAGLIRKRAASLGLAEIRKSLRRANIAISYPNIFAGLVPRPLVQVPAPAKASPTEAREVPPKKSITMGDNNDAASALPRRRLQSTDELFALGRLTAGTTLTIRGREGSAARVLDGRTVEFKGERVTFNDWGQRVTGWPSIRIYTMACLPDGRTLDQLRDQVNPEGQSS